MKRIISVFLFTLVLSISFIAQSTEKTYLKFVTQNGVLDCPVYGEQVPMKIVGELKGKMVEKNMEKGYFVFEFSNIDNSQGLKEAFEEKLKQNHYPISHMKEVIILTEY